MKVGSRKRKWEKSYSKSFFPRAKKRQTLARDGRKERVGVGAVGDVRGDLLMSISGYHLGPRTL